MKKIVSKPMSLILLVALLIGMFGGVSAGPDSQAAVPNWRMVSKWACYDARGVSFEDCANETIYAGEPTTLCFKRTQGPRIPKGSYILIYDKDYFNGLIREEASIVGNSKYCKYYSNKTKQSLNINRIYFRNGLKAGTYAVCYIMPYYDEQSCRNRYTYRWWTLKVYNYG